MSSGELIAVGRAEPAVSPAEVRLELDLVLNSAQFAKAEKLTALLTYLCQKSIEGKASELKESVVAVEVFRRSSEYSPAADSIVRVQAHELRRRLREYYAAEGRDRPIRIEIPRGSYCPRFVRVPIEAPDALVPAAPPEPLPVRTTPRRLMVAILAALALSLACNLLFFVVPRVTSSPNRHADAAASDNRSYLEMFASGTKSRNVLLCLSNPEIFLVDGARTPPPASFLAHETIPMSGVIKPGLRPQLPYVWLHPTSDEYTGMGEAACAYHLGQLLQSLNLSTRLTQDRFLNWDRATQDGVIVLGLPYSNNWTRQNFSTRLFQNTDAGLKILSAPDAAYGTAFHPTTGHVVSDHGIISRQQTASGAFVVTLAGRTSFGTYGVGDFFTDPQRMNPIFQKLRATTKTGSLPRNFVVLLKIDISEDIPVAVSFVTLHAEPGT